MNSLHFTKCQTALQHVQSTWRLSQLTARESEDIGVRSSMVNEVQALVDLFVQKIGTDLVTYTEKNTLWHTGIPREMRDDSQARTRTLAVVFPRLVAHQFQKKTAHAPQVKLSQPWEYVTRVATSRSVGEGCAKAEWWHDVARHLVQESMFFM